MYHVFILPIQFTSNRYKSPIKPDIQILMINPSNTNTNHNTSKLLELIQCLQGIWVHQSLLNINIIFYYLLDNESSSKVAVIEEGKDNKKLLKEKKKIKYHKVYINIYHKNFIV